MVTSSSSAAIGPSLGLFCQVGMSFFSKGRAMFRLLCNTFACSSGLSPHNIRYTVAYNVFYMYRRVHAIIKDDVSRSVNTKFH
ncbi:hypothetical protein MHBO_005268 [Bonamia ostreae]|uniref:Secreted protein n=1 Tax=Bonamia ostreae TaxID=126728 RepID=A0ABV2AVG1_9EUKA